MSRPRLISVGVLAMLGLVGLVLFSANRQGSDMTPREAKQHVTAFAEDTIAQAAPGRTGTLEHTEGRRGSCHDQFGGATDQTSRTYTWALTDIDDPLAEQLVARTEQRWTEQGIDTRQRNRPAGVTAVLGSTDADGFGYKLTVNRNEGMAWVTIQTPCLDENPANAAP